MDVDMDGRFSRRFARGLPWALCLLAGVAAQPLAASEAMLPVDASVAAPAAADPVVLTVTLTNPAPAALPVARSAYAHPVAPTVPVMAASYYGLKEAPRGEELLRQAMLAKHNDERVALGLTPLVWDSALAQDAARYAAEMVKTNVFGHSNRASRAIPSGENLWMGPRRLYSYEAMAQAFLDEKTMFIPTGKLPDISTTGHWQEVAHYTQMIWRGTQKVGCAVGDGANYEYLVCRYYPAGNAYGRGPFDRDDMAGAALAVRGR